MKKSLMAIASLFVITCLFSQDVKYGKITPADFNVTSPVIDSGSDAVVISDIGTSEFEGNTNGWFSVIFKRHTRVKILNKNGFNAATVFIRLYSNGKDAEKLQDLRATTYNLENGAVVPVKMENKSVFESRLSKTWIEKKFTLPTIKEGSIIEYTYTIQSDFIFNLQPWEFQGKYPVLYSKYEVSIPEFFGYVTLLQGYLPFADRKTGRRNVNFSVTSRDDATSSGRQSLSSAVDDMTWVIKDAPAMKEESFTTTIDNHITKIEFQLAQYRFPNRPYQDVMGSWAKVNETRMEREDFGSFKRNNGWLDDDMKLITKGAATAEEKARKIYAYVRDNFTCTAYGGTLLSDGVSLKDVFKKKSGTTGDINLLLLAMLRHESITANPVLVSSRSHGKAHPIYPLMDRFNYLVCEAKFGDTNTVYLDASHRMLGFNKLPELCYSGLAYTLGDLPAPVSLDADSLTEEEVTNLIIINDDKGFVGTMNKTYGDRGSYRMREKMAKSTKEEVLKTIAAALPGEVKASSLVIDSLRSYDEPFSLSYDLKFDFTEDVVYFNPLLGEAMKKNPFSSARRLYPVEMPSKMNEVYILNMEIPKGYAVDEMPKSVRFKLNDTDGMFEYLVSKSAERLQMRCRIALNKANFANEDYESLREFFSFVIQKQGEQIVFKKIKS